MKMELLPCPFCGDEALPTAHLTYNWFAPVCRRCNARGPSVKIERDSDPQEMRNLMNQADENWNRRASPARSPEVTDAMALAFHSALTDGSIGQGEIDELKVGLRAALAAAPTPPVQDDRKDAEILWKALQDLSFECDNVFSTCAPSRETYNKAFAVLDSMRHKYATKEEK